MTDLYEVIETHSHLMCCEDNCRLYRSRYFRTKSEVIELHPELTEEDHEYIRNFIEQRREAK